MRPLRPVSHYLWTSHWSRSGTRSGNPGSLTSRLLLGPAQEDAYRAESKKDRSNPEKETIEESLASRNQLIMKFFTSRASGNTCQASRMWQTYKPDQIHQTSQTLSSRRLAPLLRGIQSTQTIISMQTGIMIASRVRGRWCLVFIRGFALVEFLKMQ
jgi:hypothetical protein